MISSEAVLENLFGIISQDFLTSAPRKVLSTVYFKVMETG